MEYSDLLTVASIHATILSIIAAAVGISVSLLNAKKLEIMDRALGDLRVIEGMFPVGNPRFVQTDIEHNTEVDFVRAKFLNEFSVLAAAAPLICDPSMKWETPEQRGEKAFLGLISLAHRYPFSAKYEFRPGGIFQGKGSLLREGKVSDYIQWYEDARNVLSTVVYLGQYPGNNLLRNIEAYQIKLGEPRDNPRNLHIEQARRHIDSLDEEIAAVSPGETRKKQELVQQRNSAQHMLDEMQREANARNKRDMASDILETFSEAQKKLQTFTSFSALKRYNQVVRPGFRDTLIISLILTFFFGVFLPMFQPLLQIGDLHMYILYVLVPVVGHTVSVICAYQLNSY